MKKKVESHGAPAAIGPYSQAIESDDLIFCSAQIGLDATSGRMVEGGIEAETHRVFGNLRAVLAAAGLGLDDIVRTTIYLIDLKDFEAVNLIYSEHFKPPYPARATVQVAALPRGARIEMDAIARRPQAAR